MIVLLQVLAVLAVVFGVAVVLTGRTDGLSEEAQDLADTGIPRDRAMTPRDVVGLRFALAFRGYRMNEVDDALDRLAAELAARDEEIERLRAGVPPGRAEPEPVVASGWERMGLPDPEPDPGPAPDRDATQAMPVVDPDEDAGPEVAAEPEYAAELEPEFAAAAAEPAAAEPAAESPAEEAPLPPVLADAPEAQPAESPIFGSLTPPADGPNPFRPEVPEIPAYDPWAVTPKSRYTEGPTYVEVDDETDDDETVDAIAEHHTGYAPPAGSTEPDDTEERPPPPWQR